MALIDKLTAIADAIRAKTGGTDKLSLDQMASTVTSKLGDVSGVTAGAGDVIAGKVIVDASGNEVTGTITDHSNQIYTISAGGAESQKTTGGFRLNGNNLEVIPGIGYWGSWSWTKSHLKIAGSTLASTIGLTAAKIVKGNTILGIAGTAASVPSTATIAMLPTTSATDTIKYGTLTTGGSVQNATQVADIFNITKTSTTGFALNGTGYARWAFPTPRTVKAWLTRTTYSYLGELMIYGEKSDGTLVQLVSGTYDANRGYGNNNGSMLLYQESADKTTQFVAVRMMNPRTNTSYVVRPMFMFWLG